MYIIFLVVYMAILLAGIVLLGALIWVYGQEKETIRVSENWQEINRKQKEERDKWDSLRRNQRR